MAPVTAGERKGLADKLSPGPGLWFQPSVWGALGTRGTKGLYVNKEQHNGSLPAHNTADRHPHKGGCEWDGGPRTPSRAREHTHERPQKRIEQCAVTRRADV